MNNKILAGDTVTVQIKSNNERCVVTTDSTVIFTSSNWEIGVDVSISVKDDDLYLAKDSTSYSCLITHTLKSSNNTSYDDRILTLDVLSSGCGEGEYLGQRGDDDKHGTKCICSPSFFLPLDSECQSCPPQKSICDERGMTAPKTAPGWWRADATSSNLIDQPFYKCLPNQCMGTANTSNATCAKGYDQNSPKCSTCAEHYIMTGGSCVSCPSREESSSATNSLLALVLVCMLFYILSGCVFLSRPALSIEIKEKITKSLSHVNLFMAGMNENNELDRKSFSKIMSEQNNELNLTPREADLVFDNVDVDGGGTITLEELHLYTNGHKPEPTTGVSSLNERKTEMEDESGWSGREDIAEQKELIEDYLKNIVLPTISLKDFPGITLPFNLGTDFQLPSFNLIDFPGIDISNVMNIKTFKLPSIDLCDFPNIVLPGIDMNIQLVRYNLHVYRIHHIIHTNFFFTNFFFFLLFFLVLSHTSRT